MYVIEKNVLAKPTQALLKSTLTIEVDLLITKPIFINATFK